MRTDDGDLFAADDVPEASICWGCGITVDHTAGHVCEALDD